MRGTTFPGFSECQRRMVILETPSLGASFSGDKPVRSTILNNCEYRIWRDIADLDPGCKTVFLPLVFCDQRALWKCKTLCTSREGAAKRPHRPSGGRTDQ